MDLSVCQKNYAEIDRAFTDEIWTAFAIESNKPIAITHTDEGRKWELTDEPDISGIGPMQYLEYVEPGLRGNEDFKRRRALYIIEEHTNAKPDEPQQLARQSGCILDPTNIRSIQAYFASMQAPEHLSPCMQRLHNDALFGAVLRDLDPHGMRSFAPLACICAYGLARLARYDIDSHSNPKIINMVAKSGGGKDWILGTHPRSKSLYRQLLKEPEICAEYSENASITGNGLSLDAFLFAAKESEKGEDARARVCIRPEFGNAATRGYGSDERAGSIANYDISLDYGEVKKPRTKGDLKDLKDYRDSYPYLGIEIRAYQDINGAKALRSRFAGAGEGRRELSFWISNPTENPACNDENAPVWEKALKDSAFTPNGCERAFARLAHTALPAVPIAPQFEDEPRTEIRISPIGAPYMAVYRELLKTVQNPYYRADKSALIRDRLQFLSAISAGLHGRIEADEDDYWIAGAIVEALATSMDSIMEAEGAVDEASSIKRKIIERVEAAGVKGVRDDKLSFDRRALDELCGKHTDKDGNMYFEPDAPLVYRLNARRHRVYFAAQYVDQITKERPDLRSPLFSAAYGDAPAPKPKQQSVTGFTF